MTNAKAFPYHAILTCSLGLFLILIMGCSGDELQDIPAGRAAAKYAKDDISVILHDMNYDVTKDRYLHRYKVLYTPEGTKDSLKSVLTNWYNVGSVYFDDHVNDLGMSILRKYDGKVATTASPPGFDQYIGNEKYGSWEDVETDENGTILDKSDTNNSSLAAQDTTRRTHRSTGLLRSWIFYRSFGYMGGMFGSNRHAAVQDSWKTYNNNYKGRASYYGFRWQPT